MNYFVQFTILCMYFDIFLPTTLVLILSHYVLSARWYVLNMWYMNFNVYIFYDLSWFFIIFLAFYVAFCVYRPSPIRVAETDPSRCRPSRRPRLRLWTMTYRLPSSEPTGGWTHDSFHSIGFLPYSDDGIFPIRETALMMGYPHVRTTPLIGLLPRWRYQIIAG